MKWEEAAYIFYEATVKDGFCKICGEKAPPDMVEEEPFSIGDCIEHLPGCFFGRMIKASDFMGH